MPYFAVSTLIKDNSILYDLEVSTSSCLIDVLQSNTHKISTIKHNVKLVIALNI